LLAVAEAWCGIAMAYYTDWPASFCIAALSAVAYFSCLGLAAPLRGLARYRGSPTPLPAAAATSNLPQSNSS